MNLLLDSLSGLIPFFIYFGACLILLTIFIAGYMKVTPSDEMALIKENNAAASVVLSAAFIGFSLPLASAAINSVNFVDFIIWGIIAGISQLSVYLMFRKFYPLVAERIDKGEMAVSLKLGSLSITVGLLNAACMTY